VWREAAHSAASTCSSDRGSTYTDDRDARDDRDESDYSDDSVMVDVFLRNW